MNAKLKNKNNDCVRCCICYLLGWEKSLIPKFYGGSILDQTRKYDAYLKEIGFNAYETTIGLDVDYLNPNNLYIGHFLHKNGKVCHAVVINGKGEIVFEPAGKTPEILFKQFHTKPVAISVLN
jgi:hypothetical protein